MAQQNRFPERIIAALGTFARIGETSAKVDGVQGELAYSTDTKQLFVHDGTQYLPVGQSVQITTVTDTYQVLSTDQIVICNKATAFTVTLPVTIVGMRFDIKNIGVGTVTVVGNPGTDTIDDVTSQAVEQWENLTVICYASNKWAVV